MDIMAVTVFLVFVAFVLGLSFYLARKSQSASGYFAAGGEIHWGVNGVAFAGDYLSAASFLGICGMIATVGYDGFLYSIGYLAGWIVALFIVGEPMKRLGKYTFTDALDSRFNHRGIQLIAGISTLVVSVFYLIPQMVGAGVLVTPLLGLPHAAGVIMVGVIVITIVATAGMRSTTYVQFIKGTLLIVFSTTLVVFVCVRGLSTEPDQGGRVPFYDHKVLMARLVGEQVIPDDPTYVTQETREINDGAATHRFVKIEKDGVVNWWVNQENADGTITLTELASETRRPDGETLVNGMPAAANEQLQVGNLEFICGREGKAVDTGSIGPVEFLSLIGDPNTLVRRWKRIASFDDGGFTVVLYSPTLTPGNRIMRPGLMFKVEGTGMEKLNFVSLMLALFFGTAALPHILIRYYTVRSPACARKSTIVAIAAIGFFYVLTLYMGLGAMVNLALNPADGNMSAPLLARSFNRFVFAAISAIAFATVLGTVSGLIIAASGAVAHDLLDRFYELALNERQKVVIGKAAACMVGLVAIILGIVFKGMNVSFLVGWAFAVAASANLPAIVMLLFWKKTTPQGIVASIVAGIVSAIGIILMSPEMFVRYGLPASRAWVPLSQPGVVSIPLAFLVLIVVSLLTQNGKKTAAA